MAPVQNKFIIVPNAPNSVINGGDVDSRPSLPPMTTKQAKKAYNQKNKGPKLSKAEQRRQELFEQDRIRREFEREKNQAKARAARDRKKEKEEKEKAEKKKKGLPLVEVHPSQDTISRFVFCKPRKPPSKEEHQALESVQHIAPDVQGDDGDSDSQTLSAGDEDEDEDKDNDEDENDNEQPPPKKQRMESPPPNDSVLMQYSPEVAKALAPIIPEEEKTAEDSEDIFDLPKEPSQGDDDGLGDETVHLPLPSEPFGAPSGPGMTEEVDELHDDDDDMDIFEDILKEIEPPRAQPSETPRSPILDSSSKQLPGMPNQSRIAKDPLGQPAVSSPVPAVSHTTMSRKDAAPPIALPTARRVLQDLPAKEVNVRDNTTPLKPHLSCTKQTTAPRQPSINSPNHIFRKPSVPTTASRTSSRPPSVTPMGPPPRPPKFRSPIAKVNLTSNQPKFINKNGQNGCHPTSNLGASPLGSESTNPPSSTQQFMFSHLDDFFPSPSQEVRELYEEPVSSLGTKPSQAMSTSQDSVAMSSPSLRQIPPARKPLIATTPAQAGKMQNAGSLWASAEKPVQSDCQDRTLAPHRSCESQANKEPVVDIPFFSSQDFLLSQDWMDFKEDTDVLSQSQSRKGSVSTEVVTGDREPPSIHNEENDSKSGSICYENRNDDASDQPRRCQSSLSSQRNRNGRKATTTGHRTSGTPNLANTSQAAARSQNTPDSRSLTVEKHSDVTPVTTKTRKNTVDQPAKAIKHRTSQSQRSSASKERRMSQRDAIEDPEPPSAASVSRPRKPTAPPRPSPKPLFASTNRDFRSKYLMERNKTAAWEGSSARRKVQAAVDQFNREEEEAAERLLMEFANEHEEPETITATPTTSSGVTAMDQDSSGQPPPSLKSLDIGPKKQTINQLASCPPDASNPPATAARRTTPTQRSSNKQGSSPTDQHRTSGQRRRPQSKPGGSYEEMLALLGQQQSKKTQQPKEEGNGKGTVPPPPPAPASLPVASQETDYGDVELDDELYDFF